MRGISLQSRRFARSSALLAVLVITALPLLISCSHPYSGRKVPAFVDGVLDLRDWDFEKDGPVTLDGEWDFYWGKFKEDIAGDRPGRISSGAWNSFVSEGKPVGGLGYATYRLTILLPEPARSLALKTGGYDSAAKLSAAGFEHSIGRPARTRTETFPVYRQDIADLPAQSRIDLHIEVANFFHKSGGMLAAPVIDLPGRLRAVTLRDQLWQGMLTGIFFIFGVYHLLMHMIRRNKVALYFGLYCVFFCVRTMQTGEEVIHVWFRDLDLRLDLALEYFGLFTFAPVFALFLSELFPQDFPRLLRNFFIGSGVAYMFTLLLPPEISSQLLIGFQAVILLVVLTGISVAVLAVKRKREGALIFLGGFACLGAGIFVDVITNVIISVSMPFSSIGMVGFVVSQAAVIARRFSNVLSNSERLSRDLQIAYTEAVELKDRLARKEKMATIGDMAAGIVHDLKNPVGIIKGSVEMASDETVSSQERQELLHIIDQEADRMLLMTQDLLDFSHGAMSVQKREVELGPYIDRVRKVLLPNFQGKGLQLAVECSAQGTFPFDPDRFLRVLVNIAGNAADAMSPGGTFALSIAESNTGLCFTLADNGPGVPESIRETLFQPFVTHGKTHGTGLGTAIAKSIVEAHGGRISFDTQTGRGTTFVIEVPR